MIRTHGIGAMLKRANERRERKRQLAAERDGARTEGRRAGIKERDEQYTLYVAAPQNGCALTIGEQPEHEYVRVALTQMPTTPLRFDDHVRGPSPYALSMQTVTFRAVKHGWTSGNGQNIIWWGWELAR